ncbi:MAG: hypothetical protein AAFR79_03070 [Pseudomonadota bacterium]
MKRSRFSDELGERFGLPEEIILDNGPEGTSRAMFEWSERAGVRLPCSARIALRCH